MKQFKNLFAFLTTLWGALAATAIAFPGATAFLDIPIAVEHSKITALYPVIGTIGSAFCLLILLSYQNELKEHSFARKLALRAGVLGFLLFFSFVMVRAVYLDVHISQRDDAPSEGVFVSRQHALGLMMIKRYQDGVLVQSEERGDPLDVLALALFAATFASFTLGFSALGIHTFKLNEINNNQADEDK